MTVLSRKEKKFVRKAKNTLLNYEKMLDAYKSSLLWIVAENDRKNEEWKQKYDELLNKLYLENGELKNKILHYENSGSFAMI